MKPRLPVPSWLGVETQEQMRFEFLEPRRLMVADVSASDRILESDPDVFYYSSDLLSDDVISGINDGDLAFSRHNSWHLPIFNSPLVTDPEGYLVGRRVPSDFNSHTMFVAKVKGSPNFGTHGVYTRPDFHHLVSFDIRFPRSEADWLSDHDWAIVMQMWGPREEGELARNPPLSIYTSSEDGQPVWRLATRADSRRISVDRTYEDEIVTTVPLGELGKWQHWDLEYVADPFGNGMLRAWLDGELVVDLQNIQTGYYSHLAGEPSGPLNPSFGLYSPLYGDHMEAHFDDIRIESNGEFGRSIAGVVESIHPDQRVVAVNKLTNKSYETYATSSGVYALNVPAGSYVVTAHDPVNGDSKSVEVDAIETSPVANIKIADRPEPPPTTPTDTPDPSGEDDPTPVPGDDKPDPTPTPTDGPVSKPEDPDSQPAQPETPVTPPPVYAPEMYVGDFDGDGVSDTVYQRSSGNWLLGSTNGAQDVATTAWGFSSPDERLSEVLVADFTGDGLTDLAMLSEAGDWQLLASSPAGFVNQPWGSQPPEDWTSFQTGDFDGDGGADIIAEQADGSLWVRLALDKELVMAMWDRPNSNVAGSELHIGDYNGDGVDDVARRDAASGAWRVSESTGTAFESRSWSVASPVEFERVLVADINGDGLSDLIGRTSDNVWLAEQSTGVSFESRVWSVWDSNEEWLDEKVVDVNGDGLADVVARASSTDQFWATLSNGDFGRRNRPRNAEWGPVWDSEMNWLDVEIADYNGDSVADILVLGVMPGRRRLASATYSISLG